MNKIALQSVRKMLKIIGMFEFCTIKTSTIFQPDHSFIADIGANLTDPMFQGVYNGSAKHQADLSNVLERGWVAGLEKVIVTCGTIFDCEQAFKIVNENGK